MIRNNNNSDDYSILPFFINPKSDPLKVQIYFCHNLIFSSFQKGNSPCKQELQKKNLKTSTRSLPTNYKRYISRFVIITITIESLPPNSTNQPPHRILFFKIKCLFLEGQADASHYFLYLKFDFFMLS